MRLFLISLLTLLPLLTHAHMAMEDPPALRYKTNPYKLTQDYDYVSPLLADGSNYPCKGHHKDMGTSAGTPVRTYAAGGTYTMKLAGSATHMGGSCQLSLSYDKGKSFEVFKSFVGGCVRPDPAGDQSFKFKIPEGTPGGKEVLFAWSWFNNQGNREMYMNCAVVTITGGGGLNKPTGPVTGPGEGIGRRSPISSLANKIFSRSPNPTPELHLHKRASGVPIFKANIGNGCLVPAGKDLMFPNPGSQVETAPGANIASPLGTNCGSGKYVGGGGGVGNPGEGCQYYRDQGYACGSGAAGGLGNGGVLGKVVVVVAGVVGVGILVGCGVVG